MRLGAINLALIGALVTLPSALSMANASPANETRRPANETGRMCTGKTTSLAWGAFVRDGQGRCVRPQPREVAVIRPSADVPYKCEREKTLLGGAIQICNDATRTRAPR